MSLKDLGFRYVFQNEKFSWLHPANINPNSVDCTDMPDAEFELFVENNELRLALKRLASAADVYAADQSMADDPQCGLTQPITVNQGNELSKALKKAWEFLEAYF